MYSCEKNGADSVSEKMVQQTLLGDLEWKNPIEMVDIELFGRTRLYFFITKGNFKANVRFIEGVALAALFLFELLKKHPFL